jgi:type I restriction enzyme S subunit
MSELPQGWEWKKLGEVGMWGSGGTPKSNETTFYDGSVPWIRSGDLPDTFITKHQKTITELGIQNSSAKWVPENAVLIAIYGATIGKLGITTYPVTTNQAVAFCQPNQSLVTPVYLFLYLLQAREQLISLGQGGAQPNISQAILKQFPIPLPPLEEQRRIVAQLDVLLGRNKVGRQELSAATQLIKRQRQAVLAQMNEMAANHSVPSLKILDVVKALKTGPFGSSLHKSDYIQNGIPVINPMHINDGLITPSTDVTVSQEKAKELSEFLLQQGDIVIARRGIMGRCAVVTADQVGWLCGTGSMIVRPHNYVLPKYLQLFLSSEPVVRQLEAEAVGSTMINLNQKILLNIPINLPSLDEQREIVRRIEAAFARIDEGEQAIKQAFTLAERLEQATLAKAFRGEL